MNKEEIHDTVLIIFGNICMYIFPKNKTTVS